MLQVELDIPYLNKGTQATKQSEGDIGEIDRTLGLVGLRRWYGKLALDLDVEVPVDENAALVSRFSESTAACMGMSPEDVTRTAWGGTKLPSLVWISS